MTRMTDHAALRGRRRPDTLREFICNIRHFLVLEARKAGEWHTECPWFGGVTAFDAVLDPESPKSHREDAPVNRTNSSYDPELQMFPDRPREPDLAHLQFLRWLAEQGRLEHPVVGLAAGTYGHDQRRGKSWRDRGAVRSPAI
jgi:hypothetical protein